MKTNSTTAALLITALAGSTQSLALDLGCLNGTNGFVINGIDAGDLSGGSVSSAGDINADGIDDLLIGAAGTVPPWVGSGESYVVFGRAGVGSSGVIELAALDGTNGFVLKGIDINDNSGVSVSSAGDVNGDGADDLIIGARFADPNGISNAGESYVVFGGASVGASGTLQLSLLDGTNGFVVNGINTSDIGGNSVSSAGDVNGDGIDDIIIGAIRAGSDRAGQAYIVFGSAGVGASGSIELASLNGTNGFVLNGIVGGDHNGKSVSSAGDVNGDGIDDIIVGAYRASESYLIFGGLGIGASGSIELASLNGTNGFVLSGTGGHNGTSVSSAGDVNGDGVDDFITGAFSAGTSGESYVIFGGNTIGASDFFDLSSLDGTNGFLIDGTGEYSSSGYSVSSAGDINGDGVDDVIIGANDAAANGNSFSYSGASYVLFGGAGIGTSGSIDLASLDGTNGFILTGIDDRDHSGSSVSSAGDVNGDGVDDVIIGAYRADPNGKDNAGETYVVFGSTTVFTSPEDLNASGCVTADDLALLLASWNSPDADLNADGTTNSTDLAILLAAWTN